MAGHSRNKKRVVSKSPVAAAPPEEERLQKVLAAAGVGSRRKCEELIQEGRVDVDGQTVTKLGTKVDGSQHEIKVDGELITQARHVYFMVHKPPGIVSTSRDPAGRARVIDLVPPDAGRLFNVGRLDQSSEGLILVTNDGDLANRLTHPKYGIEKTYHVQVAGHPGSEVLATLRRGVHLAEGFAKVSRVRVKSQKKQVTTLEIVLDEGRNREIRRLLASVGHKVLVLKRVAVGPLKLGDMPQGAYRPLERGEIQALRRASKSTGPGKGPKRKRRKSSGGTSSSRRDPVKPSIHKKKRTTKSSASQGRGSGRTAAGKTTKKKAVTRGAKKATKKTLARGSKKTSKKVTARKKPTVKKTTKGKGRRR